MKIRINENQYVGLTNLLVENKDKVFQNFIRQTIKNYYTKHHPENWGSINEPDKDCVTGEGVIGVFPHIDGVDEWSILNRFDSNGNVHKAIYELYKKSTDNSNLSFEQWITNNAYDLFGIDGAYTQDLVNINRETIDKGNQNEDYAINVLNTLYKGDIKRYCAGSIKDTLNGQDLLLTVNNGSFGIQVKPLEKVLSVTEINGDTYFEVYAGGFNPYKYKEDDVKIFMFVNSIDKKYILFKNERRKLYKNGGFWANPTIFYEEIIDTNINPIKSKKIKDDNSQINSDDAFSKTFNSGKTRLNDLMFRKKEITKMIKLERERLSKLNNPQQ